MAELSRRDFIGSATRAAVPRRAPNLFFVFADQHSADMLGCYGNERVRTPNLDRLASQGVRFRHCVSSYPLCTPYRATLLSGQHPLYSGALRNDLPLLANNGRYIGHVLAEAGYRLGYVGKWRLIGGNRDRPVLPGPMRYGFAGTFWTDNCHVDFRPAKCFYWNERGEEVHFDEWEVDGQTRQALEFTDRLPAGPSRYSFPCVRRMTWASSRAHWFTCTDVPLRPGIDRTADECRRLAVRPPCLSRILRHVHRRRQGVRPADGEARAEGPGAGHADGLHVGPRRQSFLARATLPKNNPQDSSTRVPLIVRYPGRVRPGGASDLLVGTLDLMPTVLGMLGLKAPETAQGRDLWPEIRSGRDGGVVPVPLFSMETDWRGVYTRDNVYAFGQGRQFVLDADGRHRLVEHPVDCFYDRRRGPDQKRNLFHDRKSRAVRDHLHGLARRWMDRFGDSMMDNRQLMAQMEHNDNYPGDTRDAGFRGRPIDIIRGNRAGKVR